MKIEIHLHWSCKVSVSKLSWSPTQGQSLTRNFPPAFFLNSHLLPTCCFLPFLLSALCLVLPLSWSDFPGVGLALICSWALAVLFLLCDCSLNHYSKKEEHWPEPFSAIHFLTHKLRFCTLGRSRSVCLWPLKLHHRVFLLGWSETSTASCRWSAMELHLAAHLQ